MEAETKNPACGRIFLCLIASVLSGNPEFTPLFKYSGFGKLNARLYLDCYVGVEWFLGLTTGEAVVKSVVR